MTPRRSALLRALLALGPEVASGNAVFRNRDLKTDVLVPSHITNVLGDLMRLGYVHRTHKEIRDGKVRGEYRYRVIGQWLVSRSLPDTDHQIADKLLLLQGIRLHMDGRALSVMNAIIKDYEVQYGRT